MSEYKSDYVDRESAALMLSDSVLRLIAIRGNAPSFPVRPERSDAGLILTPIHFGFRFS